MHRSACRVSGSTNAHDAKHEDEAEEGATPEGSKKTPIDQRMTWFLSNCGDQQCRHCDVIGEVNQCVRQGPRHIARVANDPASHDYSEYRENEVSDPHEGYSCTESKVQSTVADRPSHSFLLRKLNELVLL
jgi:hypothetical protein